MRMSGHPPEIHRISMAVPLPLHEILEGKQVSPLRCRLIAQTAEGAELMVYPGSDGLSADQLNADLTDFVQDLNPRTTPDGSALSRDRTRQVRPTWEVS
jgi:hypothetical protein